MDGRQLGENGVRFGHFLERPRLGDGLEPIAQRVQLGIDGLRHRQLGIGVAFLGDQLLAHLGGAEAGIQAFRLEGGINLALAIHDAADVGEQVRQVRFGFLAAAQTKRIQTDEAALQFVQPLADGAAIPPQFACGVPLPAGTQLLDRFSHEGAAIAALQFSDGVL